MCSDRLVRPYERLAGEILDALHPAATPALIVLSGPAGTELGSLVEELLTRGVKVAPGRGAGAVDIVRFSFGSWPDVRIPARLPAARGKTGRVVALKDVQYLDPAALVALEALVRQPDSPGTTFVCNVALPVPPASRAAFAEVFDRLRRGRPIHHVNLRPLARRQLRAVVAAEIEARPEPALVDWLWCLTRGWPGAVRVALGRARDEGLIRVAGRHAFLAGGRAPHSPAGDELVQPIREAGSAVWAAAKAMAVLGPLGDAAPGLVAEALGIPEGEARGLLARLQETGVVRYRRVDAGWQYRVPLVEAAVRAALGPFERRRLAQLAVSAVWRGTASCADPGHLLDQVMHAGTLVDPERARTVLLAAAENVGRYDADRVLAWLRAAADLEPDLARRTGILLRYAQTCLEHGRLAVALGTSELLLDDCGGRLGTGQLLDLCFVHLAAVYRAGEPGTLEEVATGAGWTWPGGPLVRSVARALALSLLGRWGEARDLLGALRNHEEAAPVERHIMILLSTAALWQGEPAEFERELAGLPARHRSGVATVGEVDRRIGELLTLGEFRRAGRLLADTGRTVAQLGLASRMIIGLDRGRPVESLELTGKSALVDGNGCDAVQCVMYHHAATLLLCRGQLTRAGEMIAVARTRRPALPHLLASPEALHLLVYGELERAESLLRAAVRRAETEGVVVETDALWVRLADVAVDSGRPGRLAEYLEKVETIARRVGTERAEISRLTLHAAVHADRGAADTALRMARDRQHPLEEVAVLARLVRYGLGTPEMLSAAYALLGELDALMARAWLRNLMRDQGVPVPGRKATAEENERLLAVLVAESLGNKEIAKALQTSEKSVEARLSRLFSRTGYRSRVELASAMLTGRLFSGAGVGAGFPLPVPGTVEVPPSLLFTGNTFSGGGTA